MPCLEIDDGTNSFHKSLSTHLVNSDRGVAALVRIDADDHHGTRLPPIGWVAMDRSIGISPIGATPRSS